MRLPHSIAVVFLLLFGLDLLLLITVNRRWWVKRWVRRTVLSTPLAALLLGSLWLIGARLDLYWLSRLGASLLSALYLYLAGFLIALSCTGLFHLGERIFDWMRCHFRKASTPVCPERRLFLRRALAGVPLLTSGMITGGIIRANAPARLPQVPLYFPDLPVPLEGLRLLHLSDIHIGPYIQLADLEQLLERASQLHPDLILVTGDLCDHNPSYPDTVRLIEELKAPLGTFACLGNHEYYRGLGRVRQAFSRSTIPLLVDEGLVLPVGSQDLHLSGANDPVFLRTPDSYQALERFVHQTQEGAPAEAFRILMSHRSQGFDYAAPLGVDLTLSGHTHGFQVGFGGRSLFESMMPERYIWGHYRQGHSQLYTSAGVGHWFPFRLGCPPEAPLYILHHTEAVTSV